MSRRFTLVTLGLVGTVMFLVGLIVAGSFVPAPAVSGDARIAAPVSNARPAPARLVGAVDFADIAARMNAAVVNIDASSARRRWRGRRAPDDWFDRGLSDDPDAPRHGAGSGFIIDRDGYILTNHHVIDGAERIVVSLADGRAFRATLVGADPAIDVALLRIPASGNLPVAPLGDSDTLRVGEWVCAIGNPLGYVHSVTVGVVSFIGRKLFDASLDDYIQTDAAINFGNSGGPLINARGEVIGINSAISSRANNIGFAIPINQARAILPQLKTRGRVARGFIGVMLTDATPELQRSLALGVGRGALVQDVTPGSPAERAGIRPYDVVVGVDSREIWASDELIREISARQPGTTARLRIVRDGRERTAVVKLAERPTEEAEADSSPQPEPAAGGDRRTPEQRLGLAVRDLDPSVLRRLGAPDRLRGVLIARVDPAGPAFSTNPPLRRGQVVLEINRRPVGSVADYNRLVSQARSGETLVLYVYDPTLRQRSFVTVTVDGP
ncbi:MAG TPA: trypsin-like peptidase domain-containing protein [Vicinamibacterales bacterium]|nr:trypsin-like peptidase domain-containing protein [Vicinamibacterales bacterium]